MDRRFAALLVAGVLTACDASSDATGASGARAPGLAMPVPLSEDQGGEPQWTETCADGEDGSATCIYDDGQGTVCEVVGDAEGEMIEQKCRGDWGTYDCTPSADGYSCVLTTPDGSCTDEYDASGQWVGGTCGDYYGDDYYEDEDYGDYEEECAANDDGGYTCTYDDGETQCKADVDASGELIAQWCEGAWGTYDCAREGAGYECVLTVEGQSCVETYDLDYMMISSTCPDYYYEEPGSSSEPSGPCSTYNGMTQCWTQSDVGYCYEFFVEDATPPVEELTCDSAYRYVCNDVERGSVCIYYENGVEVCRDSIDHTTYEGEQGCNGVHMGPLL